MTTLARICTRWRFAVLGGWITALVALVVLAIGLGTAFTDDTTLPDSESATAYSLLGRTGDTTTGTIAWHAGDLRGAAVRSSVTAALDEIATMPGVEAVVSPYSAAGTQQINNATGTAYATVVLDRNAETDPVVAVAERLAGDTLTVTTGGPAFTEQPGGSHGPEAIGLIAALVILALMFRSAWGAVLPILTGVVGVGTSLLIVVLGAHVVNLSATSLTMGALIGLGVGIDYALFIVNRHRKAMLAGSTVPDGIGQALNTSGRAVVFAGATVIVALLGMYVVDLGILTGMAQAAAVTVLVTVLAAVTLLPALLAILGRRVLPRSAVVGSAGDDAAANGPAARWARLVQRAPLRVAGAAGLVIVLLALPVLSLRVGDADASSDPDGSPTRAYYEMMAEGFGAGFDASLLLVARNPDKAAFDDLVEELSSVPDVSRVVATPVTAGQPVAVVTVTPATSAQAEETTELVHTLREKVIPASGLEVYVGGTTATGIDLSEALLSKLPLYLGLIALLGFLLLAVAFRSLLVPLVGAISNIATILVGMGAVTALFQFGWATELLRVGSGAPVMYLIPVLIVGIMFGLSMDYQVFLVSRMHEEWAHTRDNARAIRVGLTETTKVVAAAATIMLCVFASFGFSGERIVSMIGIGLAIAVFVDAFVVRLALIPALMTLLGRANWYYPRGLAAITPKLSIEGPAAPAEPAPTDREPVPV
ncbi:MMPL family transporter [Actinoplanes sp. NPDC051494]|uniref:MMPL family transporter n=1 Tax=Actinoplanes sp. NPDC051494 TaxID=3363907 RepID=UPI0037A99DB1